jgi:hypothetical protein
MEDLPQVDLSGDITERINAAHTEGKDLVLSYVDPDGRPHQSIRGSTHVHRPDQIAVWVRENYVGTMTPTRAPLSNGGFLKAIESNPAVSLIYRNAASRTTYVLSGRARVESDQALRDEIYANMPASEQQHSKDHSGTAVIIDIDHVVGGTLVNGTPTEKVEMVAKSSF